MCIDANHPVYLDKPLLCVGCGASGVRLYRHSVIHKSFLRSVLIPRHRVYHDMHYLCSECHRKAVINSSRFINALFKNSGINHYSYEKAISIMSIMENNSHWCRVIEEKKRSFLKELKTFCKSVNVEFTEDIGLLKKEIEEIDVFGKIREKIGLNEFTYLWRKYFLEMSKFQFLPDWWDLTFDISVNLEETDKLYKKLKNLVYTKNCILTHGNLSKARHCVYCGITFGLTRHHVIPLRFIDHSKSTKAMIFHNLQFLCKKCHVKYEQTSTKLTSALFEEAGIIPYYLYFKTISFLGSIKDGEFPISKYNSYSMVQEAFKLLEIPLSDVAKESYEELIKKDVYTLVKNKFDEKDFIIRWRRHFLEVFAPKYISQDWTIDYGFLETETL